MKFEEDLATMFDVDAFAQEAVILQPVELMGTKLVGLFDNASSIVDIASGIGSSSPAFTMQDAAIPPAMLDALKCEDVGAVQLEIDGITYTATTHEPDGNGCTSVRLRA